MRIGYFGGSFDPPHRGHLAVANAAAGAFGLQKVLFVPTGHQPLKPSGPIASYADRLAMLNLLCVSAVPRSPGAPSFSACTLEAPLPDGTPNYTVDTLTHLKTTLAPEDQLFVLLGADAFLQLPQWRGPDQLLALADWIIVSRPGFDQARLALLPFSTDQRRRIHLLPTLADPTSATALRRAVRIGTSNMNPHVQAEVAVTLAEGLPPAILTYIRQHHLYGT